MNKPDKILVVDDDASARLLLQMLFTSDECESAPVIIQADNGKIALELLDLHPDTDVILLDIYMPEIDGFDFLKQIKELPLLSDIPVCVLTGSKDDVVAALKFGASDFVTKPYNAEELKLRVSNLVKLKRKYSEIEQCKRNFLATISHELRTPMNGIIGMSELLNASGLSKEQSEYVDAIGESSEHLLSLINDILQCTGNTSSQMEIPAMPFRLSLIAEELRLKFSSSATLKGLEFIVSIPVDTPDQLLGYPYSLRQVLHHLVSNALKFTDCGRIEVVLSTESACNRQFKLHCSVRDTGIGIPYEMQLQVFEPFVQGDGSSTRRFSGLGIGLSLAYQLVQRMGGAIVIDSSTGSGSCFSFTVDCQVDPVLCVMNSVSTPAPDPHPVISASSARPGCNDVKGLKVLLVEDLVMNQRVVARLLKLLGHSVTIASNGADAVSCWNESGFDIIFMDIHMPIMDGIEATQHIRQTEKYQTQAAPIIAMTADVMNGTEERCLKAGMNGYVSKPVALTTLMEVIQEFVGGDK